MPVRSDTAPVHKNPSQGPVRPRPLLVLGGELIHPAHLHHPGGLRLPAHQHTPRADRVRDAPTGNGGADATGTHEGNELQRVVGVLPEGPCQLGRAEPAAVAADQRAGNESTNSLSNRLDILAFRNIEINVPGTAISNEAAGSMNVTMTPGVAGDGGGVGQVNWINGTINIGSDSVWRVDGRLSAQGSGSRQILSGSLDVARNGFSGAIGTLRIEPGSSLTIGNGVKVGAEEVDNQGDILLSGADSVGTTLTLVPADGLGVVENQGTIRGQGAVVAVRDPMSTQQLGRSSFVNRGTLQQAGNLDIGDDDFTNSGSIVLNGSGISLTVISNQDLVQGTNTGLIRGEGLVSLLSLGRNPQKNLDNAGTIEATGELQLAVDSLRLTDSSNLIIDLTNGTGRIRVPNGQIDQIAGSLAVTTGTVFSSGESFPVLIAEGFGGTAADFSSISVPPEFQTVGIVPFNSFAYLVQAPTIVAPPTPPTTVPPSPPITEPPTSTPNPPDPQPPSAGIPSRPPSSPPGSPPTPPEQPPATANIPRNVDLYEQIFLPSRTTEATRAEDPLMRSPFTVELIDRISNPNLSLIGDKDAGNELDGDAFTLVTEDMTPEQAILLLQAGEAQRTQDTQKTINDVEPPEGAPETIDTDSLQRALRRAAEVIRAGGG